MQARGALQAGRCMHTPPVCRVGISPQLHREPYTPVGRGQKLVPATKLAPGNSTPGNSNQHQLGLRLYVFRRAILHHSQQRRPICLLFASIEDLLGPLQNQRQPCSKRKYLFHSQACLVDVADVHLFQRQHLPAQQLLGAGQRRSCGLWSAAPSGDTKAAS